MESAEEFKNKLWKVFSSMYGDIDEKIVALIEARDHEIEEKAYKAAMASIPDGGASCKMCSISIRKECADKIVGYLQIGGQGPIVARSIDFDELYSIIMGN